MARAAEKVTACLLSLLLLFTGVNDIVCCTNGEPLPPKSAYPNPRCEPIAIPKDDPYNAPEGNTCINFVRTSSNKDKKCRVPGKVIEPVMTHLRTFLFVFMLSRCLGR